MSRYSNVFEYVKYVVSQLGCQIAIKDFVGFTAKDPDVADVLNPYYIHKSSFCMYMKSNREMWTRCQDTMQLLQKKCEACDDYFTGSCYCGCSEMVIPVKYEGRAIAAICIYGFELDQARAYHRISKAAKKYKIDREKAIRLYNASTGSNRPDFGKAMTLCGILADYLKMYYKALLNAGYVNINTIRAADTNRTYNLSNAIEYIRQNYMNDIKIADIAAFCHCSESYLSHIFKKGMNQSINNYINQMRIDRAKDLIAKTSNNFYEISGKCGFADPNYFSSVFKRITGLSPSGYKKSIMREIGKK